MNLKCPCQSGLNLGDCCLPYLNGHKKPPTAETLMRSRYCAYTRVDIRYIKNTMKPPASNDFSAKKSKIWARSVKWLGLTVVATEAGGIDDDEGFVTFKAWYEEQGKKQCMTEKSRFEKHQSQWYYVESIELTES